MFFDYKLWLFQGIHIARKSTLYLQFVSFVLLRGIYLNLQRLSWNRRRKEVQGKYRLCAWLARILYFTWRKRWRNTSKKQWRTRVGSIKRNWSERAEKESRKECDAKDIFYKGIWYNNLVTRKLNIVNISEMRDETRSQWLNSIAVSFILSADLGCVSARNFNLLVYFIFLFNVCVSSLCNVLLLLCVVFQTNLP